MNTKRKQKIVRSFFLLMLSVVFMAVTIFGGGFSVPAVYAASNDDLSFDETYVMDDLEGMTINGKAFDIADYGFDESRNTGVILFTEYCYSFYANKQSNYGLYVYVWNPQGLQFDLDSPNNKIEFGTDPDYTEHYTKYSLDFLSVCEESNYEGLFYKFKVYMTDSQRTALLNSLDSSERFYHVSGIELVTAGDTNATDWAINLEYRFSGYAAGYGSNDAAESTLVCNTEQGEVLTLDVHSTYYYPEGTHSDGITRDVLQSVYFSVPNEIIEKYGEMSAVHATWLDAYTAPILVTGNSAVYNALYPYLGQYIDGGTQWDFGNSSFDYAIVATSAADELYQDEEYAPYFGYYAYNFYRSFATGDGVRYVAEDTYDYLVYTLRYLFLADNFDAGTHFIRAETLLNWFATYTEQFGGDLVGGNFSSALFDEVADEYIDKTIRATDEYLLTDNIVSNSAWDRLFGSTVKSESYIPVSAIQAVTMDDLTAAASVEEFCDKFYIAEADYDDFYAYVEDAEIRGETVYLFRYKQSEYISVQAIEYERVAVSVLFGDDQGEYDYIDANACFAQMWVQLNFDIIDVTFTNGGVDTIIPVVMSPVDIAPDGSPPASWQDEDPPPWWAYVIVVVAELVVLLLLRFILCTVCGLPKWVWWILFAVVVVLDIFFIATFAWWVYSLF